MAGVVPATGQMTDRLTLGYRQAVTTAASPIGPGGYLAPGPRVPLLDAEPGGDALRAQQPLGRAEGGLGQPDPARDLPAPPPRRGSRPGWRRSRAPVPYVVPYVGGGPGRLGRDAEEQPVPTGPAQGGPGGAGRAETGRSEAEIIRAALTATLTAPVGGRRIRPPARSRRFPAGWSGSVSGPGTPDLVTVRAVAALRRADRVLAPTTAIDAIGRAEAIVRQAVPGVAVERVAFAMSSSRSARNRSVDQAAGVVARSSRRGRRGGVGDPRGPPHLLDVLGGRRPGLPEEARPPSSSRSPGSWRSRPSRPGRARSSRTSAHASRSGPHSTVRTSRPTWPTRARRS